MARPDVPPESLDLTPRQREVLDLLAKGCTNPQIAEHLGISLDGAKWHVSEVLARLDVQSREAAANYWRHHQRLDRRVRRAIGALLGGRPAKAGVGVAGVVVVGLAAFVLVNAGSEPEPTSSSTPVPTATQTQEPSTPTTSPSPTVGAAIPGDPRTIVYLREEVGIEGLELVMHETDTGRQRTIDIPEDGRAALGDTRIHLLDGRELHTYDLDGSRAGQTLNLDVPSGVVMDIAVSPQGRHLAVSTVQSTTDPAWTVQLYSLPDGQLLHQVTNEDVQLADEEFGYSRLLRWRDDGRGFVVLGGVPRGGPAGLLTFWLDGNVTRLPGSHFYALSPDGHKVIDGLGVENPNCMFINSSDFQLVDLENLEELATVEAPEGLVYSTGRWSPDSTRYVFPAFEPDDGNCDWAQNPLHWQELDLSGNVSDAHPWPEPGRDWTDLALECDGEQIPFAPDRTGRYGQECRDFEADTSLTVAGVAIDDADARYTLLGIVRD